MLPADAVALSTQSSLASLPAKLVYKQRCVPIRQTETALTIATSDPFELRDERGLELLTFHSAKGREWHTVFVTGVGFSLSGPAMHALIPSLVPPEDLDHALRLAPARQGQAL